MHKSVSNGYTMPMSAKDSGLRIRVERDLRERFLETCRAHDRPAAQVLREFMRRYIAEDDAGSDTGGKPGPGRRQRPDGTLGRKKQI